jgi:hypothetical protein
MDFGLISLGVERRVAPGLTIKSRLIDGHAVGNFEIWDIAQISPRFSCSIDSILSRNPSDGS